MRQEGLTSYDNHPAALDRGLRNHLKRQPLLRSDMLFINLLVIVWLLSWYPRREGSLDLRWDGSVYYVLGTSLAQGTGYRLLNEPGGINAVQYPPMLPAIIAVHQKIAGTDDPFIVGTWLKLSWALCSAFVVAGAYVFSRKFLPPLWARLAALLYVFNLPMYLHFNMLSAEVPFTVALIAFFLANPGSGSIRSEITAGIAALTAFLSRTAGLVLFVAWIGDAVLKKQFRRAAMRSAIAVFCVFPWYAYIHWVESSPEYRQPAYAYQRADYLYSNVSYANNMAYIDPYRPERGMVSRSDLLQRVIGNAIQIPAVIGETITSYRSFWVAQSMFLNNLVKLPLLPPKAVDVLLITLGCLALGGIAVLGVYGQWLIVLYVLATLGLVCTTPWPLQHVRYLSPSTAIFLLGLCTALYKAQHIFPRRFPALRRGVYSVSVCLIALMLLEQIATYHQAHARYLTSLDIADKTGKPVIYKQLFYHVDSVAMDECITWIAKHANKNDIVSASMAHWVYLRTGLKAVIPPLELDAATANELFATVPVRYVIRESPGFFSSRYVANAVQSEPGKWRQVYVANAADVRVYERVVN